MHFIAVVKSLIICRYEKKYSCCCAISCLGNEKKIFFYIFGKRKMMGDVVGQYHTLQITQHKHVNKITCNLQSHYIHTNLIQIQMKMYKFHIPFAHILHVQRKRS